VFAKCKIFDLFTTLNRGFCLQESNGQSDISFAIYHG